jgi:hypothetical protein
MRIYNEKDSGYKRTVSCAYCHREGHNKRHCPHLKAHYLANKTWNNRSQVTPVGVDISMFPERHHHYYSDGHAIRQFRHFFNYAKSVHDKVATPTTRKRKKPKCGFCGKTTHNRRNCKDMKAFVKLLEETNGAYRELFYDTIIEPLGLGVGAFVETAYVEYNSSLGERRQHLISHFDLDKIGIGNLFHQWGDYAQGCMIRFAGSDRHYINFGGRSGLLTRDLFDAKGVSRKLEFLAINNWGQGISEVIAPAPSIPTKEWFLGQNPAFSWVVKKKNLNILWSEYRSLVNRYHPNGAKEYEKWEKKLF